MFNYIDQRHDHLCRCPGCNYDGPEPTEAEIQEMEAAMQESIVIECDTIEHTEVSPFCSDWECPCHGDVDAVNAVTGYLMDGLLTWFETNLILRGATI